MNDNEFTEVCSSIQALERTVEYLEKSLKLLMREGHTHHWTYNGDHDTNNLTRTCDVCDEFEEYVYPMIPYEKHWKKSNGDMYVEP
jgi:hypothetical protein